MLNCEGDLHIFPFDSPMCTFAIESGKKKNKYFLNIVKPCLLVINNFNPFYIRCSMNNFEKKKNNLYKESVKFLQFLSSDHKWIFTGLV